MFDKKVIGICFGDHIYSFELWGCNFFLPMLLLLLFVGIIKLQYPPDFIHFASVLCDFSFEFCYGPQALWRQTGLGSLVEYLSL